MLVLCRPDLFDRHFHQYYSYIYLVIVIVFELAGKQH